MLTKLLSKLYGNKKLWITEYGYQTSPPDRTFGVSWAKQAKYLTQAYAIARKNPQDHDDALVPAPRRGAARRLAVRPLHRGGKKKPAYDAFRRLPH